VTNAAIAAYVHVLQGLGLSHRELGQLWEATDRNLTVPVLRFQGRVSCTYVGQEDVKVVVAEREVERNAAGSTFLPNSISSFSEEDGASVRLGCSVLVQLDGTGRGE
jgi:hypothetical protein